MTKPGKRSRVKGDLRIPGAYALVLLNHPVLGWDVPAQGTDRLLGVKETRRVCVWGFPAVGNAAGVESVVWLMVATVDDENHGVCLHHAWL